MSAWSSGRTRSGRSPGAAPTCPGSATPSSGRATEACSSTWRTGPTSTTRSPTPRPSSASTRARCSRRRSPARASTRSSRPEFAQEGTIHFHYLLHENGGFLHVAESQDEHLAQLAHGLTHEAEEAERTRRFVESFLRPGGLDRSATAIYADAVEELAGLPVGEERGNAREHGRPPRPRPGRALEQPRPDGHDRQGCATQQAAGKTQRRAGEEASRRAGARVMQEPAELEPSAPPTMAEAQAPRLKILFSLLHPGYLRHYGQPIRLLAAHGHEVHVALGRLEKDPGDFRLIEELAAECPTVTYGLAPARARRDGWRRLAWLVRALTDLARYGDPRFADAPALRERIAEKLHWRIDYSRLPSPFKRPLHRAVDRHSTGADAALAERTLARLRRLEAGDPDQPPRDPLRRRAAARRRARQPGDRVRVLADRVPEERAQARHPHRDLRGELGQPDRQGAAPLRPRPRLRLERHPAPRARGDARHPGRPGRPHRRAALRRLFRAEAEHGSAGVRAQGGARARTQPFVLYLCSSPFIAPNEVGFVRRWAAAIRGSDSPALREVGLLVRPHPQNGRQWEGVDLSEFGNAAIWPPQGAQPDAGEARADYFDSLAHSACIVGINTSGLLEAGIVGKSVLTVLDPDFAGTQAGTLHFQYLRWENGGLLRVAARPRRAPGAARPGARAGPGGRRAGAAVRHALLPPVRARPGRRRRSSPRGSRSSDASRPRRLPAPPRARLGSGRRSTRSRPR